jgi:hypothetical protein
MYIFKKCFNENTIEFLILPKGTSAGMKGFLKPLVANLLRKTIFREYFTIICSEFQEPTHIAFYGFRKPFCDRTSRFQNPFQQKGFEFENSSNFR